MSSEAAVAGPGTAVGAEQCKEKGGDEQPAAKGMFHHKALIEGARIVSR